MKRIFASIVALVGLALGAAPAIHAQALPQQSLVYAANYGLWSLLGQKANTYIFNGRSTCNASTPSGTFFPFATNTTVWIADQTTSNSEVVTPSAIIQSGGTCGIAISPANQHYTFSLRSGTGGLQEAINALLGSTSHPTSILLDRNFFNFASQVPGTNPAAIIAAAKGNSTVLLTDITTSPWTTYVASATTGTFVSGTWTGAKPAAAAGAGAGTSPTISDVGTAGAGTVLLTSGTATTTGTLFTLTWATSGQFLYAPTCTVTSNGANAYTTFTSATTYPSSTHALLTVTVATTPPVASTAYSFTYSCF